MSREFDPQIVALQRMSEEEVLCRFHNDPVFHHFVKAYTARALQESAAKEDDRTCPKCGNIITPVRECWACHTKIAND